MTHLYTETIMTDCITPDRINYNWLLFDTFARESNETRHSEQEAAAACVP